MPRFVLLYHNCPTDYERASHWDLMLESGDKLRTWALGQLPCDWQGVHSRTAVTDANCPALSREDTVVAEQLGDHRRDYLQLEGPLSGNRGTVTRIDKGTYRGESEQTDYWRFTLVGHQLSGSVTLSRPSSESSQWMLEWVPAG